MNRVIKWGIVLMIVFFIVTQPADAAGVAISIKNGAVAVATGFGTFVSNLV